MPDVWAYADMHNIRIKTMEAEKYIARKNVQQTYGNLLPAISANGAFTDNIKIQPTLIPASLFNPTAPAGTYTEATFGRRYIYNANITAQFDLLNTRDWFSIKAEKLNEEIAGLNIAKSKADLYEQLANAYYSCLLLSKAAQLSSENLQTATALYDIARNKFAEGQISEVTLNTALINREKAAKSLDIAEENQALQRNSLRQLLNTNDSIHISDSNFIAIAFTEDTSFAPDPDVALSYKQMLASKTQWQSSKAAFAPTLSAVYQYNTQVAADDFLKFDNSNTIPQQYWGLRLSLPLFNGNTKHYQVQKARMDYELKQQQYEASRLQSAIADQDIRSSFNSAGAAFDRSGTILKLYQNNDAHAGKRMEEGIISLDERLKVYSELITNQNEYLQSMSDYFIQQYRLKIRRINFTE
ncbi:hypothetical protein GCM10023092_05080 [Rurimicrobium arvi]|uniref:TolC family protein n=1 Tax=Rurimicrobium arvi TaxID=2049916 RepID=A0ABP8MFS4_9BACT